MGEPPDEEGLQEGAANGGRVQAAEVRRVGGVDGQTREVNANHFYHDELEYIKYGL